jgi:hypothetical protein
MKSQSNAYVLNESEHIHWILDLEGEVHSIWHLWISDQVQECKGKVAQGGQKYPVGSR